MTRRQLALSSLLVVASRGVVRLLGLLSFLMVVRFLPPEDVGRFGVISGVLTLGAVVATGGLRHAAARAVGRRRSALATVVVVIILVAPISAAFATLVGWAVLQDPIFSQPAMGAFVLYIGVWATAFGSMLQGTLLGLGNLRAYNSSDITPRAATTAALVVAAFSFDLNLQLALIIYVVGAILQAPIILAAIRHDLTAPVDRHEAKEVLISSLSLGVGYVVSSFAMRISLFAVDSLHGPVVAGQYFVAMRLGEITLEVAAAVSLIVLSETSRNSNPSSQAASMTLAGITMYLFVGIAIAGCIAAPMLPALVGVEYENAIPTLRVVLLGIAPAGVASILYALVAGMGHATFGALLLLLSSVLNVVIVIALPYSLEAVRGAAGLAFGQLFVALALVAFAWFKLRISPRSLLMPWR